MTDRTCRARFVEKASDQLRVQREHRPQDLDGGPAIDERVLDKVDLAEGSFPYQAHDAVVAEELSDLQRHILTIPRGEYDQTWIRSSR